MARDNRKPDTDPKPLDEVINQFRPDMSEENREGDEMSGDDHSFGLQGGETEIKNQSHIDSGLPGNMSEHEAIDEEETEKRRSA